jgi:pyruvate dehydrogenase E2 component (dihydrolipoamide acetyltransferase)
MASEVTMPRMGYEMTEGTVVSWLKHRGDSVSAGEVIAEVETDKAIVELEASESGTLLRVLAPEGETVPVGQAIAIVGEPGEQLPEATGSANAVTTERSPRQANPGAIQGIRPGFPSRTPGPDGKVPLGRTSQAMARRTAATSTEVPSFNLTVRIDMTDAIELRRTLNVSLAADDRVGLNDLVIKACALALLKYPVYNATFQGDYLQVAPHVDIGIAVAMPEGLAVPAVLECENKFLPEIARDSRSLANRVREGTLKQREYTGTFTISNLGMFDVDAFNAIIVSPQVGVLALGSIQATPMAHRGNVVVRQVMSATLSTDHRAASGAEAAQFAGEIKRLLEKPALLV